MVVDAKRLPYDLLARTAERLAAGVELPDACRLLAEAVAAGTEARLAVVRVLDEASDLYVARAAAPAGSPLAAESSGSGVPLGDLMDRPGLLAFPAVVAERVVGAIELWGDEDDVDGSSRTLAEVAAALLGLVLRDPEAAGALGPESSRVESMLRALEAAGETLAAGAEADRAAGRAAELAARATGALAAAIWTEPGRLEPIAQHGEWPPDAVARAETLVRAAAEARRPLVVEREPGDGSYGVAVQLGQPAFGVLVLRGAPELEPEELASLASFAARVSHALRLGERAGRIEVELERTRALLTVLGEASERLSLAHALDTAIARLAELLAIDRVGIYLRDDRRLRTAAGRGLDRVEGDGQIALALLELATGPLRARDAIEVRRSSTDPVFVRAAGALDAAGEKSALAVLLRVADEAIGILVAYPGARRATPVDGKLLAASAAQLAVTVQNARLHERELELGDALGSALDSERRAARQLGALYEISSSFARSLSLDTTLATVTTSIVRVLGVDAAAISMRDERGDMLVPRAVHVADERLAAAVRTILERPQPVPARLAVPLVLDVASARRLGGAHELLVPFLEKGSTAALLPIATPHEVLAMLTIVSLDPAEPLSAETITTATSIAAQAALAIDNARLYQQQKAFAETIQRALLPRHRPQVRGLEVGAVYEAAARVDVGGDLYDFLELGDGRLAIVLGDVTGHGVDATADMAMAKFVFRSLAREHPEPGDFLAHANEVIADEIVLGKFITMAYVTVDGDGVVTCASAGHPAPRIVDPSGRVEPIGGRGLALGIDAEQRYTEAQTTLAPGGSVVLFTDGVTEARSGRELYGDERLDALLGERCSLGPQELADAVLDDCRAFGGGELGDDCAVVVARRT